MNTIDDYYAIARTHIDKSNRGMIILRGIPASGKTTLAHQIVRTLTAQGTRAIRIGRDDVRRILCTGEIPGQKCAGDPNAESMVTQFELTMIKAAANNGIEWVIEDSTNIYRHSTDRFSHLMFVELGVTPLLLDLEVDVDEAIARDVLRTDSCGEDVIRRMHAMKTSIDEGDQ